MIVTQDFSSEWSAYRQTTSNGNWVTERAEELLTIRATTLVQDSGFQNPQLASWEALREGASNDVDALVRVRVVDGPGGGTQNDLALCVRLPEAPFTHDASKGHYLLLSSGVLRVYHGIYDPTFSPGAGETFSFGAVTLGSWYWMRLQATTVGSTETVRGKIWADGDAEPDWLVEKSRSVTSLTAPLAGGTIGVGPGGNGGANITPFWRYEWDYAADLFRDDDPPDPPAPIEPITQEPQDRLRSSVSADSGSILASVQAIPFDASHSISFNVTQNLSQTQLYPFREVTRDQLGAVNDAAFFPRATQNNLQERAYEGVTLLSLMRNAFPAPLNATTATLGIADPTAQAVITYVLTRWATEFPWFTFAPVPDLRTPVPGSSGIAKPSEYDPLPGRGRGIVRTERIAFPQNDRERRSAYEILTDLLSPFPGAVFFGNSAGELQIVPAYGPDADEEPYRVLDGTDVVTASVGEANAADIFNRATVSSRGYRDTTNTPIMQPSWFQFGPSNLFSPTTEGLWFTPPNDRNNLQATADGSILQESMAPNTNVFGQGPLTWPLAPNVVPAGAAVRLIDADFAEMITVAYIVVENESSVIASGTGGLLFIEEEVPFDGENRYTLLFGVTVAGTDLFLTINARWDAAASAVVLEPRVALLDFTSGGLFGKRYSVIVEFTLNDASAASVETPGPTATYGVVASGDSIPGVDGVNAIEESQAAFGVLEKRVDIRGYVLPAGLALAIAQGLVLANLTPRATREYELGWKGSTQVLFDDRGRLFGTLDGGQGLLVGRAYRDDFVSVSGGVTARFEETVPGSPGSIPVDGLWLLNDDGSFWQNDDGSFSPPA